MWLYLIHTYTHSSLVNESKATNDISWSIDDSGNISPADKTQIKGAIEIPSVWNGKPVTGIASFAFWNCSSLTSVTFAEDSQLTSIGYNAFSSCSSLTSTTIPNSVTSIGNSDFTLCPLADIKFNSNQAYDRVSTIENGKEVGAYIIAKDDNLSENTVAGNLAYGKIDIELPDEKNNITNGAFSGCLGVNNVNIPSSVTNIGEEAFGGCKLKAIDFNRNEYYDRISTK